MLFCMRTTLNLDDAVMRAIKKEAAESGRTMTEVIDETLRDALLREPLPRRPFKLELKTVRGRAPAGVDLTDRDALFERMEGRG